SVGALFDRHADDLAARGLFGGEAGAEVASGLRRIERYWTEQIRYIY
ncbi:MAG: MarR family transcriptional regulator, partial [Rhodobacterales bacterium CG_4_10_14_0_8_um_filter_70_9]